MSGAFLFLGPPEIQHQRTFPAAGSVPIGIGRCPCQPGFRPLEHLCQPVSPPEVVAETPVGAISPQLHRRTTFHYSRNRAQNKKRTCCRRSAFLMPPVGVEPTYSGFSVQRLNQLSYSGVGSAKLGQTRRYGNGRSAEKSRFVHKGATGSCGRFFCRGPDRFAFSPQRTRIFWICGKSQGSNRNSEHQQHASCDNM